MALVVLTGGARSGKSSAAVRLADSRTTQSAVTVVAFGQSEVDQEFADRIAAHKADRPSGWITIEARDSTGWVADVSASNVVVLDCLGTLLGLAMDESLREAAATTSASDERLPVGFVEAVEVRLATVLDWVWRREGDTIIVTNEVGDGVVPPYAAGRFFRDALGRANRTLVERADVAYLCVAGRLVDLKSLPTSVAWPED